MKKFLITTILVVGVSIGVLFGGTIVKQFPRNHGKGIEVYDKQQDKWVRGVKDATTGKWVSATSIELDE